MLNIEATKSSPCVVFCEQDKALTISGESYPENSFAFFEPIFEWFHNELPKYRQFILKVNISYMNSSSTKCMLDILDLISSASEKGCDARVVWYYEKGNERALDLAEEFKEDLQIPFEIIGIEGGSKKI